MITQYTNCNITMEIKVSLSKSIILFWVVLLLVEILYCFILHFSLHMEQEQSAIVIIVSLSMY